MSTPTSPAGNPANPAAQTLERVGRSAGWTIAFGLATVVVGVLILIWPGKTVLVLAVLLALQLLVAGIFYLVAAFAVDEASGGQRVLFAILGVITILVAMLFLREPMQTVAVVGLLLGLIWTAGGLIEIFHGITGRTAGRGMAILSGTLSLIAGIIVLVYPEISLATLAWLAGLMLVIYGVAVLLRGWAARRTSTSHRHSTHSATGRPETSPA